jgi:hypothetical protein
VPEFSVETRSHADNRMIVQLSVGELRALIAEEVAAALDREAPTAKDKLLTPQETARILGQNVRWLYRHAARLPFTRRLSRKCLRFSETGLTRWLAAKRS